MAFARNLDYRCPVRRMEYVALERIYASDSRVFTTKIVRFVWNMPSISGDSKKRKVCHTRFIVDYFKQIDFTCGINIPVRHFEKIFHDCEYLQLFTRFLYISL